MNETTLALVLFFITYMLMIAFQSWRFLVAAGSACIFVTLGMMPLSQVADAIDWNVLLMLAGTMGTVALFIDSKMPSRIADLLLSKCRNAQWAAVSISLFAGAVSAFVDNVATVLMIAPVALAICKKLNTSPVPMLITISVSSNLQGAATLVGDTTSIMLGGYAHLSFLDFFVLQGRAGIFWAVELGAIATVPVIMILFRRDKEPISVPALTPVKDFFPTYLLLCTVLLLICASFVPEKPDITNGVICMALCIVGIVRGLIRERSLRVLMTALREIDYATLILLAGLFVVIGGITNAGVVDLIAAQIVRFGGNNPFLMYTMIVWGSVLISAFVDNIPYVATMLPVVSSIAAMMNTNPILLYFGLLTGATLGGNLTPIGASANIAAIGILNRAGYQVTGRDFMRIGVPFTLTAVTVGYLFNWFLWS